MADWTIMLNNKIIKQFTIKEGERLTIGRGSDADVVIDNTAISRKHSALELNQGVYFLADLGSLNGTFINGQKVNAATPVAPTDDIMIGKFKLAPAEAATGTVASSSSVSFDMDKDDETVFVTSKKSPSSPPAEGLAGTGGRDRSVQNKPKHWLAVLEGEASPGQVSLDGKTSIKLGKDRGCDLVIPGFFVAKAQCYIIKRDDNYIIIPQKSWIKTRLNDLKITAEQNLRKGDIIQIRQVKIRFE